MSEQTPINDEQERIRLGQSAARGATGDGRTGVPDGEQGISNRPGDTDPATDEDAALEAQRDELDDDDAEEDEDDEALNPTRERG